MEDLIAKKINTWTFVHALLLIAGAVAAIFFGNLYPLVSIAGASFLGLLIYGKETFKSFSMLIGWPNVITVSRFIGIGLALLLIPLSSEWTLALILTAMVLLDLLDGYVARRLKESSTLGLHLDMEVDAFFVIALGAFFYLFKSVEIWILLPGILRYLYVITINVIPKEGFQESKQRFASTFAGIFFTLLLIAIVLDQPFRSIILACGSIMIVYSFSMSFSQYFKWENQ